MEPRNRFWGIDFARLFLRRQGGNRFLGSMKGLQYCLCHIYRSSPPLPPILLFSNIHKASFCHTKRRQSLWARIFKCVSWPGIDSKEWIPAAYVAWRPRARICRPFQEPRNRFPAWRAGTTTLFGAPGRQATQADEIDSSDSIPGLHKRLQIRAQNDKPLPLRFLAPLDSLKISDTQAGRVNSLVSILGSINV